MSERPRARGGPDDGPQDAPAWTVPATPTRASGPNWGLALLGLLLMGVASVVLVEQVTGVASVTALESHGPLLLVAAGVACALVGVVGMARRRP